MVAEGAGHKPVAGSGNLCLLQKVALRNVFSPPVGDPPGQHCFRGGGGQFSRWLLAERAQGFAQLRCSLVSGECGGAVGFAQLVAVCLHDQRYVQVAWLRQAKKFLQVELARS